MLIWEEMIQGTELSPETVDKVKVIIDNFESLEKENQLATLVWLIGKSGYKPHDIIDGLATLGMLCKEEIKKRKEK